MNRYYMIRRLTGPAFILLTGVLAMLNEWTSLGFHKTWPLYIILAGLLALGRRWALAQEEAADGYGYPYAQGGYPPPQPAGYPPAPTQPTTPGTSIVPSAPTGIDAGEGRS